MKKTALLPVFLLALALTACGKGGGKDVDMKTLSANLQETVTSGALAEVSADILASTYFLDMEQIEDSLAALNSGANACEVTIVKCKDNSYVSEVKDLFETRVKNQSDLFASYNAGEVTKLEQALIESSGNYVVLCVTDDTDAAKKILKEAGF